MLTQETLKELKSIIADCNERQLADLHNRLVTQSNIIQEIMNCILDQEDELFQRKWDSTPRRSERCTI